MSVVTLLTDFGLGQEYVGVMHGVILGICPLARIVDISHNLPPQDVGEAADMLAASWRYFPTGTVHVAVVDPGVGSTRAVIAAAHGGHCFVAPDNGLLSKILDANSSIRKVTKEGLFLPEPGNTFHGRDVFAPVGAHIAAGLPLDELGPPVARADMAHPPWPEPRVLEDGTLAGEVVSMDRFGNLATNIQVDMLWKAMAGQGEQSLVIRVGDNEVQGLSSCYSDAEPGNAVAVINSRKRLEVAVREGSAGKALGADRGTPVIVVTKTPRE
ncbi:MAG: S-adenosyl-l-methionine hydroxide adenosyltransferase family protein [Desulfatibacillaceae bacterium]